MTARIGEDDVIAITGNPIYPVLPRPSSDGFKNEPEVYERIMQILPSQRLHSLQALWGVLY